MRSHARGVMESGGCAQGALGVSTHGALDAQARPFEPVSATSLSSALLSHHVVILHGLLGSLGGFGCAPKHIVPCCRLPRHCAPCSTTLYRQSRARLLTPSVTYRCGLKFLLCPRALFCQRRILHTAAVHGMQRWCPRVHITCPAPSKDPQLANKSTWQRVCFFVTFLRHRIRNPACKDHARARRSRGHGKTTRHTTGYTATQCPDLSAAHIT